MNVGDKVILKPPKGPYIGLEAVIIKKIPSYVGEPWFSYEFEYKGIKMTGLGPAKWVEPILLSGEKTNE